MNIVKINKYRDGGSMSFEYEDGHTIWIKGCGIDGSEFFDGEPGREGVNKLRMSNKDIHNLISNICHYYEKETRDKVMFASTYTAHMLG